MIRSIDALVAALRTVKDRNGYLTVLERIDIAEEAYAPHCSWSSKQYTRNCIVRTPEFELLLICYEPGQRTSIHDYDSQQAWVMPVVGEVVEERFQADAKLGLKRTSSAVLGPGSFSYFDNSGSIHRYLNVSGERAVTLNLYAPPLRRWRSYDERTGDTVIIRPGSA